MSDPSAIEVCPQCAHLKALLREARHHLETTAAGLLPDVSDLCEQIDHVLAAHGREER